MKRVLQLAERFARAKLPILLVGATGTGKELIAQHIHQLSGRPGELVDVNCGALPREMVESLLFGHRRGAFTGAVQDSAGLVTQAAGGTLFLDELSSLPLEAQAKLLRVLETREVRRLGDLDKQRIDFRLVSAVQDDLAHLAGSGLFRLDLLHRVQGARIELPPLAQRAEDILPLAVYFASLQDCVVEAGALNLLLAHSWPGNVRELRAAIDRAVVFAGRRVINSGALGEALRDGFSSTQTGAGTPRQAGAACRRESAVHPRLVEVCATHEGDRRRIAAALGISVATLYRRLRAAGLSLRRFSDSHRSHRPPENGENSHGKPRPANSLSVGHTNS